MSAECFFAHLGGCEGRLVKAHLVPKQRLKVEIGSRVDRHCDYTPRNCPYNGACADCGEAEIRAAIWDERTWRWMCGGPTGLGGHHGQYDAKQIRIPREQVPPDLVAFLAEHGLEWMVERYF